MVTWKRERVRNFGEDFANAYIRTLVELDGQPYEQPRFFEALVATGIVSDVDDQGDPEQTDTLRFKRWDAYSNRIREYGLGFAEQRFGGPMVWRVSEIARAYDRGELSYRELMALQLTRTQVPVPAMPIGKGELAEQIARGLELRPLTLTLRALHALGERGEGTFLSEFEFSQLQRVEDEGDLRWVVDDIVGGRSASESSEWVDAVPSVDIWFNELCWTSYLRRVAVDAEELYGHALVPRWARQREAEQLDRAIPVQRYTDIVTVNRFHDFFTAAPGAAELAILRSPPDVVVVDVPTDATWDPSTGALTGHFGTLGGLERGDSVILRGSGVSAADGATVFEVVDDVDRIKAVEAAVKLERTRRTIDKTTIDLGSAGVS